MSCALWIPTTWMLVTASKPLAVWFGSGGEEIESGSPLDRAFLIVLLCVGVIILVRRKFKLVPALQENTWVSVLITYMLVSIVWSELPFISGK
ncbi:MAG: hypothetical protein ABIN58_06785, partial [candidate division WOR-3 bacterium]